MGQKTGQTTVLDAILRCGADSLGGPTLGAGKLLHYPASSSSGCVSHLIEQICTNHVLNLQQLVGLQSQTPRRFVRHEEVLLPPGIVGRQLTRM